MYVHIRHWLFWYGNYGFCDKSCEDEVTIYLDKDKATYLGCFEITTRASLQYHLNNEIDKLDETEFYNEIESFLENEREIYYSYIYPRDDEDIQYQVKHFAPTNGKGHKPIYIDMWSKLSDGLDINEIKKCVKILVKEFFHTDVLNVEILDIPTYEGTKVSYNLDYAPHVQ